MSPRLLPLVLLLGSLAACDGEQAPPFPEGQGQAPGAAVPYPSGPYGIEKGSVITNFKFEGFPNPDEDKTESVDIQLADFYNQSGTDVFPDGSPLGAGEPKPTVLLLNIGAVWCGPCQEEADTVLPGQYAKYSPKGVQFLFVLADGPNQGVPAGLNSLVSWTTKYETLWPATIDPSYTLGSLFKGAAYPVNIVVDTETMKIVEAVAGLPEEDGPLFQALDELTE